MKGDHSSQRRQELPMSSNDDSPVSQPQPVEPGLPSSSNENPQTDTVDALLRIIFKLDWKDWGLIAAIALCLIAHYISVAHSCPPPVVDIIKIITVLISVVFIFRKISSAYKSKESIISFFEIHPIQLFVSIIACGATTAFFLPLILNIFKIIGDTDKLTTALLASTGGVIAVFTLIKTHQKNQNDEISLQLDREKYEQQKEDRLRDIEMQNSQMKEQKRQFDKKTKQEAYSSHQERIRQIHAERRSRYTTAVEQLANEKAPVRLGGIYTLVGLVDEWIADETLTPENQQMEGQVIINSLCSYIRSPFSLAIDGNIMAYDGINYDMPLEDYEGDYRGDQAKLIDEQDTRISIFKEISSRINNEILSKNNQKHWNNFSYNFSRSVIFYPLRNLSFSEADFSFTIFIGDTSFESSQFLRRTSFTGGYFKDGITFKNAYFKDGVDFSYTNLEESADFNGLQSTGSVIFQLSKIPYDTDFSESYFPYNCNHIWNFIQRKDKPGVKYGSADLILPNNEVITKDLPVGARLFDPDSWDDEKKEYTCFSNPAKPRDSDTQEEQPAE